MLDAMKTGCSFIGCSIVALGLGLEPMCSAGEGADAAAAAVVRNVQVPVDRTRYAAVHDVVVSDDLEVVLHGEDGADGDDLVGKLGNRAIDAEVTRDPAIGAAVIEALCTSLTNAGRKPATVQWVRTLLNNANRYRAMAQLLNGVINRARRALENVDARYATLLDAVRDPFTAPVDDVFAAADDLEDRKSVV